MSRVYKRDRDGNIIVQTDSNPREESEVVEELTRRRDDFIADRDHAIAEIAKIDAELAEIGAL